MSFIIEKERYFNLDTKTKKQFYATVDKVYQF